jgi:hypothetical protein
MRSFGEAPLDCQSTEESSPCPLRRIRLVDMRLTERFFDPDVNWAALRVREHDHPGAHSYGVEDEVPQKIFSLMPPKRSRLFRRQPEHPTYPGSGSLTISGNPPSLDHTYVLAYVYLYLRRYSNGQGAEDHLCLPNIRTPTWIDSWRIALTRRAHRQNPLANGLIGSGSSHPRDSNRRSPVR